MLSIDNVALTYFKVSWSLVRDLEFSASSVTNENLANERDNDPEMYQANA